MFGLFGSKKSDAAAKLADNAIGIQSILFRVLKTELNYHEDKIKKIELTYFAAAIVAYSYFASGSAKDKSKLLDAFSLDLLRRSLPASGDPRQLSEIVVEYKRAYQEYATMLPKVFIKTDSPPAAVTLLMHFVERASGQPVSGKMIDLYSLAPGIMDILVDCRSFIKNERL